MRIACGVKGDNGGNPRRAYAVSKLRKRHGTENDSHLLHAAAQQLSQRLPVLGSPRYAELDGPYPKYAPKHFRMELFYSKFLQAVRDLGYSD